MAWNSDNPYSNYGQYGGGGMDMLYPNYTQPPLWNSFPMNSRLPANKFGGGGPSSKFGAGDPTSQLLGPYAGPTQWAGPNAYYPNWNDPPGPFANDVAMIPMGDPSMTWSPNLLPTTVPTTPVATPVPTDPSLPPPEDPWIGPDTEEAQKYHDRVKQMSEDFYRNNPEHFLSKIDSKVRQVMGVPQLGTTQNMGQGITPQTNWGGQGVTPQPEPSPQTQPQHQTQPNPYTDAAAFRHGSFPVFGPQKTGMEWRWGGALTPRTSETTRPTWQENNAMEEAAKMRGRKAREQRERMKQATARRAAQRRGTRSAEGAGRDGGRSPGAAIDRSDQGSGPF